MPQTLLKLFYHKSTPKMAATFSDCVFMNIPTPLITEILARLPPNAVVRCRCVCKAWLKLLSEPEFVNLHLSKSPKGLIVHNLYTSADSLSIRLAEVEDETDHHGVRYIDGMNRKIPRRGQGQSIGMTMIGSINGLVCINDFGYQYDLINIWNPVMGEFITVQTPERKQRSPNVTTYGFGISSGKYQVVRIFQEIVITGSDDSETNSRQIRQSTCHIYTIGTGFWKNIGHAPYLYSCREHGLFLNGNLHWLIYDQNDPDQICSLDLERELFQPFPPPPELCQRNLATLNLYKGCISLCDYTSDFNMVIWVMKEYGVGTSWSKEVVIDLVGYYSDVAHIIKVFKDGEILLLWRDYKLFSYHPKRKTMQNADVEESMAGPSNKIRHESYHCIEAAEYVSSIVSVKNLGELTRMAVAFSVGVFLNIPSPIITDILARLPTDAVVRCRCVCKAWLKLLSEAEFVNLHLSKSPTGLIVHKLSGSPPDSASFSLVEVEDETDHHGVRYIDGMNRKIPRRRQGQSIGMTMIGSINGLVCVNNFGYEYDLISIWNPVMGEFITVQTPEGKQQYPNITTYGFGISSGKYQVVRIFQEIEITGSETKSRQIRQSTCYIYTIGTGFWKNIGHAPYLYSCREHGLFLNGNLHWLIYDQNDPEQICCLDLERELFQPFPPPPELSQRHLATLNLYNGCISVCDNTSDFDIVIWVMKEYGVENSWTKEAVISKQLIDLVGNYYEVVHIIKVFKDGEILFLWRDDRLFSYHPKRKTVQIVDVKESMTGPCNQIRYESYPCIEAREYVSSLVSLKNLGEVNVNRG